MRLIDADELKKKIRHWNYNATTSTPTFDFVTDEDIDECPTVDVLDKIRAEIEQRRDEWIKGQDAEWHTYDRCLAIIDKYTKGDTDV